MSSEDLALAEEGVDFETRQDDSCKAKCMNFLKDNLFMILILVGVAVGFGLGFGLRAATTSPLAAEWISE